MMRLRLPFIAVAVLLVAIGVGADELKLKDGTKISGTIVGFEENSFRVKTSYGFAVVQKDQVLSISISDSAKKPEAEKKPDADKKSEPAAEKSSHRQCRQRQKPRLPAKPVKAEPQAVHRQPSPAAVAKAAPADKYRASGRCQYSPSLLLPAPERPNPRRRSRCAKK